MSVLDARGLSCPEPVLLTKRSLEKGDAEVVKVLVDEMAACENITALAKTLGWQVTQKKEPAWIEIVLRRQNLE